MAPTNNTSATSNHNTAGDEAASTIVGAIVTVLTLLAVALRLYTRLSLKQGLKWDDWFTLIALISFIVAAILLLVGLIVDPNTAWLDASLFDADYVFTPANQTYLLLSWVASVVYFFIVCPAKLSILLMYNRIFSVSKSFRVCVYTISVAVSMFWAGNVFAQIFTCIPFEYSWTTSVSPAPYCFNSNLWWLANGVIELAFDVIIISLPMGMVARLQMNLRKRIGIGGVFLLGAFGIVTGAIKIWEAYLPGKRSPSWSNTAVWSTIHSGVGIMCACLPVCWPVLSPLRAKFQHGTQSLRHLLRSLYSKTLSSQRKIESGHSGDIVTHRCPKTTDPRVPWDAELLTVPKWAPVDMDVKPNTRRGIRSFGNDSFEQEAEGHMTDGGCNLRIGTSSDLVQRARSIGNDSLEEDADIAGRSGGSIEWDK